MATCKENVRWDICRVDEDNAVLPPLPTLGCEGQGWIPLDRTDLSSYDFIMSGITHRRQDQEPPEYDVRFQLKRVPARTVRAILELAAVHRAKLFAEWERNQGE